MTSSVGASVPLALDSLFRHPQHNREIRLGGHAVAYLLKRATRRTIGFVVGEDGLAVSAPRWVAQPDIDQALQTKAAWIVRKLVEQGHRVRQRESARWVWQDGMSLPYLGEPLHIRVMPGLKGAALDDATLDTPRTLRVGLPVDAAAAPLREAVQRWLQRRALALFEQRCHHYVPLLGVQVKRLRLSAARTRWGSASADGTVRLNWRLIHFPLETLDYVVAHELSHLREMNHSPAFWAVVRSVMPDYEARRGALKDGSVPIYD